MLGGVSPPHLDITRIPGQRAVGGSDREPVPWASPRDVAPTRSHRCASRVPLVLKPSAAALLRPSAPSALPPSAPPPGRREASCNRRSSATGRSDDNPAEWLESREERGQVRSFGHPGDGLSSFADINTAGRQPGELPVDTRAAAEDFDRSARGISSRKASEWSHHLSARELLEISSDSHPPLQPSTAGRRRIDGRLSSRQEPQLITRFASNTRRRSCSQPLRHRRHSPASQSRRAESRPRMVQHAFRKTGRLTGNSSLPTVESVRPSLCRKGASARGRYASITSTRTSETLVSKKRPLPSFTCA